MSRMSRMRRTHNGRRRRRRARLTRMLQEATNWRCRLAEFPALVMGSPQLSELARTLRACERTAVDGLASLGVSVTLDLPPWPIGTVHTSADALRVLHEPLLRRQGKP